MDPESIKTPCDGHPEKNTNNNYPHRAKKVPQGLPKATQESLEIDEKSTPVPPGVPRGTRGGYPLQKAPKMDRKTIPKRMKTRTVNSKFCGHSALVFS